MSDWRSFCRGARDMAVDGDRILVSCGEERGHQVAVTETEEAFEFTGIVAGKAVVAGLEDVALRAWKRNRSSQLVGFRVDRRGRLLGEAWMPKAGLEREEFLLYVRKVAAECDRFEWEVTGRDRE